MIGVSATLRYKTTNQDFPLYQHIVKVIKTMKIYHSVAWNAIKQTLRKRDLGIRSLARFNQAWLSGFSLVKILLMEILQSKIWLVD